MSLLYILLMKELRFPSAMSVFWNRGKTKYYKILLTSMVLCVMRTISYFPDLNHVLLYEELW